eukprot:GEMP01051968.1.p1 GENE.GEMP01051968.1~~GEMP01051968.1.p1  ORF type:complete len:521 (-),score=120.51 GEMP01051968.1:46-1575(-)
MKGGHQHGHSNVPVPRGQRPLPSQAPQPHKGNRRGGDQNDWGKQAPKGTRVGGKGGAVAGVMMVQGSKNSGKGAPMHNAQDRSGKGGPQQMSMLPPPTAVGTKGAMQTKGSKKGIMMSQAPMALPAPPGSMPNQMQLATHGQPGQLMMVPHIQVRPTLVPARPAMPFQFKRPQQYILCFSELPSEIPQIQLQEVFEQCGPVLGFRRPEGKSFGFCQFETAEGAWKAIVCLAGKQFPRAKGNVAVIPSQATERAIQEWKVQQRRKLTSQGGCTLNDAEVEWELEKTTIVCQAGVDEKIKLLFEFVEKGDRPHDSLIAKEEKRVQKEEARQSRRMAELQAEVFPLQRKEKRRRDEELKWDETDKSNEKKEDSMQEHERKLFRKTEASKCVKDAKTWRRLLRMFATELSQQHVFNVPWQKGLDPEEFRESLILEEKTRDWLTKRLGDWLGGPQPELVEMVLRRIKAKTHPTGIIADLSKIMEEKEAEIVVDRLWRMIVFEMKRVGLLAIKDV